MCITVSAEEDQFIIKRDTFMETLIPPIRSVTDSHIKMSYQSGRKDSMKAHFFCTNKDLKSHIILFLVGFKVPLIEKNCDHTSNEMVWTHDNII